MGEGPYVTRYLRRQHAVVSAAISDNEANADNYLKNFFASREESFEASYDEEL